jgi:hypothetical protein
MNYLLEKEWNKLEKLRSDISEMLVQTHEKDFLISSNGKWSLGEILIHIVTSEKLALQYMRKKSLGVDSLENAGFVEPLKLIMLKISQRLPIKYKVPKGIKDKTPECPSKDELFRQWTSSRSELKAFLESIEEKNINKKIFKHPIAGMFNVTQGVAFLREHLLHHKPQILNLATRFKSQTSRTAV